MPLKPLPPHAARDLVNQGAILIDIRAADEYARERIAQARSVPMDQLKNGPLTLNGADAVIFHCRSGARTQANAAALSASATCDTYVLEGGLNAWKQAGLSVETDSSQPLELHRQVQIAAGSLIALGAVLGATVSPWFHALSGLLGAGLVFAGLSGFCGMAFVLMQMPWNRKAVPT